MKFAAIALVAAVSASTKCTWVVENYTDSDCKTAASTKSTTNTDKVLDTCVAETSTSWKPTKCEDTKVTFSQYTEKECKTADSTYGNDGAIG